MTTRHPIFPSLSTLALLVLGCGGGETPTTTPASVSAEPPKPVASATADPDTPAPEPAAESRVDLLEQTKFTATPKKLPTVRIKAPGSDQAVSKFHSPKYKVQYSVSNWDQLGEGAHIQFIFDNVPFRPVTDPREKITLSDLAGGEPAAGEHVLAMYVAHKNREAVRGPKGVDVRRFWVGKKTASDWNASTDPFMALGAPSGTYEGKAAEQITVDYYVLNAELGDKDYSVKVILNGPGVPEDGIMRYLTTWVPAVVLFPDPGEYTLTAELVAPEGQPLTMPWNPTKRKFTVK